MRGRVRARQAHRRSRQHRRGLATFEPDETGTTLTGSFGWSSKVPFIGELMDRVGWDGDRDPDLMLATLKKGIET